METMTQETIELCGGCAECARYAFGQGYKDLACEQHVYAHRLIVVAGLRAVFATGNTERMLRAAAKANKIFGVTHSTTTAIWCCAMTMHFGPTGIHSSRKDANGLPLAETRAMPEVACYMAQAAQKLPGLFDALERNCHKFASDRGLYAGPRPSWER